MQDSSLRAACVKGLSRLSFIIRFHWKYCLHIPVVMFYLQLSMSLEERSELVETEGLVRLGGSLRSAEVSVSQTLSPSQPHGLPDP